MNDNIRARLRPKTELRCGGGRCLDDGLYDNIEMVNQRFIYQIGTNITCAYHRMDHM